MMMTMMKKREVTAKTKALKPTTTRGARAGKSVFENDRLCLLVLGEYWTALWRGLGQHPDSVRRKNARRLRVRQGLIMVQVMP